MADYIVKDTELTSVANAIRTAGGTNLLLSFPNGFVNAVNNISDGGGGGSSDFSTATLTVYNPVGEGFSWRIPSCIDDAEENYYSSNADSYINLETNTISVILYKGKASVYLPVDNIYMLSVSGNIEDDGGQYYIITGNCEVQIGSI